MHEPVPGMSYVEVIALILEITEDMDLYSPGDLTESIKNIERLAAAVGIKGMYPSSEGL